MMKAVLAVGVAAAAIAAPARAQGGGSPVDSAAPMAVVRELFDGMRAGDSARVRAVFHPSMTTLMSADVGKDGAPRVQSTPVEGFVKMVGTPRTVVYDERLYDPRVQVDGPLASIWVEYSFFVGPKFSHCGVDVFHVAKVGAAWKIIALTDTRRTTGCRTE